MDIFWIVFIGLCTLNIVVSIFLLKREDLEIAQKMAQTVIVWLVPFFGAIGLWWFNRSQDLETNKPNKGKFGGGSANSSFHSGGD